MDFDPRILAAIAIMLVVTQLVWKLLEKIVWDWLKTRRETPAAKAGRLAEIPVLFGDLKNHCKEMQGICSKEICLKLDGITQRLSRGDSKFEAMDRRYQKLDRGMATINNQMTEVIRSNGKAEKLIPLLHAIRMELAEARKEKGGGQDGEQESRRPG